LLIPERRRSFVNSRQSVVNYTRFDALKPLKPIPIDQLRVAFCWNENRKELVFTEQNRLSGIAQNDAQLYPSIMSLESHGNRRVDTQIAVP